jgi:predicted DNA-binding transcriptional regulator YafY
MADMPQPAPVDAWALLAQAIQQRQPVAAVYRGAAREFCPHALGHKGKRRHVLAYQFAGASRHGLPLGGGWRCFDVDLLQELALRPGPWRSAPNVFNPQSCLDTIEVVVQPFPPWRATGADDAPADAEGEAGRSAPAPAPE